MTPEQEPIQEPDFLMQLDQDLKEIDKLDRLAQGHGREVVAALIGAASGAAVTVAGIAAYVALRNRNQK